ncbi:MAG TPA: OmpA family protein [Stellaceae bacterium]|nr:OmpA family protein [Stellaceae bacterium]
MLLRPIHAARAFLLLVLILGAAAPLQAQAPTTEAGRYLVYFDEFSANLTPDAQNVIAEAAAKAKEYGARTVRIEGRASATGSPEANRLLTQTRTQVVYDALQKDGVDPKIIQQQPLGQTTATDTSVMERRVEVVLLK